MQQQDGIEVAPFVIEIDRDVLIESVRRRIESTKTIKAASVGEDHDRLGREEDRLRGWIGALEKREDDEIVLCVVDERLMLDIAEQFRDPNETSGTLVS